MAIFINLEFFNYNFKKNQTLKLFHPYSCRDGFPSMTRVLANAGSQGYSSTLAADLSNGSMNTALMFTISCQNHACNTETISHSKFKIFSAMMKNSGTKLPPTQKREGRTRFGSRDKEEKRKEK